MNRHIDSPSFYVSGKKQRQAKQKVMSSLRNLLDARRRQSSPSVTRSVVNIIPPTKQLSIADILEGQQPEPKH